MTYATNWTWANDADFQGRCTAALWDYCNKVVNDVVGYPDTEPDMVYANRVLRKIQNLSPDILAIQVLRNATIAADPATATDGDIEFQIGQVWGDLKEIN